MVMQSGNEDRAQAASGKQHIFIHDQELDKGGYPQDCPFNTSRAGQTCKLIETMGLFDGAEIRRIMAAIQASLFPRFSLKSAVSEKAAEGC